MSHVSGLMSPLSAIWSPTSYLRLLLLPLLRGPTPLACAIELRILLLLLLSLLRCKCSFFFTKKLIKLLFRLLLRWAFLLLWSLLPSFGYTNKRDYLLTDFLLWRLPLLRRPTSSFGPRNKTFCIFLLRRLPPPMETYPFVIDKI